MTAKSFNIVSYDIKSSRGLTFMRGEDQVFSSIECHGTGQEWLGIYFLKPNSPIPPNTYDPIKNQARIFVPAQLYGWYRDLLSNEKPVYAYCFSDTPERNYISTGNEFVGETEAMPDILAWLSAHIDIGHAIIWEKPNSILPYPKWTVGMKAELVDAFKQAWNFSSVFPIDPLPNKKILADSDNVVQIIDSTYAWPAFLSFVAQSLAMELGQRVNWSILNYSPTGLAQLFDSRQTFQWNDGEGGYQITGMLGNALPCNPKTAYSFMYNNMVGNNRPDTIANLLDWCRSNLSHFEGGWDTANVYDQWQYRGLPPVIKMLTGTPFLSQPVWGIRHWTGGCWGTVGFLRAILRTVNLPVQLVTHAGHAQPYFVEDGLYLSHGDDPYDAMMVSIPPTPISFLPIDESQLEAWFGPGVSAAQALNNIGRKPVELAAIYLPTYLLNAYCQDISDGKTHSNGSVANDMHYAYTVAQLEMMNLWGKMDNKIASAGGCNKFL